MKINFVKQKLLVMVLLAWVAFIAIPNNVNATESARYFYQQLDSTYQNVYDEIFDALDKGDFDSDGMTVTFTEKDLESSHVYRAIYALEGDDPELVGTLFYFSGSSVKIKFTTTYWNETQNAVNRIVQSLNLKETDSRITKIHKIHDYVVSHCTYGDTIDNGQTITGAVLPQFGYKAVCAGYSKLFQILCLKNNIPCINVSGCQNYFEGEAYGGHEWNMVQLENGSWYYVDCTFDDPLPDSVNENSEESAYSHKYLFYGKDMLSLQNDLRSPIGTLTNFTLPELSEKSIHIITGMVYDYDSLGNPVPQIGYSYEYTYDRVVNGDSLSYKRGYSFKTLIENEDYTISAVNDPKNHKYTFTVNGIGNCVGSFTKTITTDHRWTAWKTVQNATALSTGYKSRYCSICSAQEKKNINKLTPTIRVSRSKVTLKRKGKKNKSIVITVSNLAAGDYVLSWKSSKKKVATVNAQGKIVAKKKGKANIIVTLASGKQAVVKVTVK